MGVEFEVEGRETALIVGVVAAETGVGEGDAEVRKEEGGVLRRLVGRGERDRCVRRVEVGVEERRASEEQELREEEEADGVGIWRERDLLLFDEDARGVVPEVETVRKRVGDSSEVELKGEVTILSREGEGSRDGVGWEDLG